VNTDRKALVITLALALLMALGLVIVGVSTADYREEVAYLDQVIHDMGAADDSYIATMQEIAAQRDANWAEVLSLRDQLAVMTNSRDYVAERLTQTQAERDLLYNTLLSASILPYEANPFDCWPAISSSIPCPVPGLISDDAWRTPAPRLTVGRAVFYAPGVMEAQAPYRGLSLEGYVDGVSLMSPADIGETVWLWRPGDAEWEGPFLDLDCSMRADMYVNVIVNREVVEVGFETAERWGMAHHLAESPWYHVHRWRIETVMVYIGERPPDLRYVMPVDYAAWFLRLIEEEMP
jgi:hypothetical protein